MPPEAPCWQKLRQRVTLVNNEQCLLDLDKRLQLLESLQESAAPRLDPGNPDASADAGVAGADGAAESAATRLPDVTPIPVSQRLPELHELDRQGRCWAYRSTTHEPLGRAWVLGTPVSLQLTRPWCSFTHWLPHWSLPIVEDEAETQAA
ncbi:MAG: hypothetical protein RLZZ219_352 [Cyanobacteriota bacterium]